MKKYQNIITISLIIFIDQIIKIIVSFNLPDFFVIPNVLGFQYLKNTGIVFGLLDKELIKIIISNGIVLGIIIRFMLLQKNQMDTKTNLSLVLIVAGGISNLIDRITRHGVIDYIKILNFPIFNVADIFICIGFAIFALSVFKQMQNIKKEEIIKRLN